MSDLKAFGDEDLARIRHAVSMVEAETGTEIVTYIVGESDGYPETRWKAGALGAAFGVVGVGGWMQWVRPWGGGEVPWLLIGVVGGLALGWVAGGSSPFRHFLAGPIKQERVADRAERAFLEEEVFRTRARVGILLFLSLFERRVVILADEGLHRSVPPEGWVEAAEEVAAGMARRPDPEAVILAVQRVGRLLSEAGRSPSDEDLNELSDDPRMRQE